MNSIQHNSWGQGALGALGETLPRGLSEDLRIRGPLRNSSYADCAFPLLPHPFLLALAPRSIKWEYPMIWDPCVMRWWPLFPFSTSVLIHVTWCLSVGKMEHWGWHFSCLPFCFFPPRRWRKAWRWLSESFVVLIDRYIWRPSIFSLWQNLFELI